MTPHPFNVYCDCVDCCESLLNKGNKFGRTSFKRIEPRNVNMKGPNRIPSGQVEKSLDAHFKTIGWRHSKRPL